MNHEAKQRVVDLISKGIGLRQVIEVTGATITEVTQIMRDLDPAKITRKHKSIKI